MNHNIAMLSALYDNTAQRIRDILSNRNVNFNDPRVQKEVEWLGKISQTLISVLQIERLRKPSKEEAGSVSVPEEKSTPDIKPPHLTGPNKPHFPQGPTDFSGFSSPGGWSP